VQSRHTLRPCRVQKAFASLGQQTTSADASHLANCRLVATWTANRTASQRGKAQSVAFFQWHVSCALSPRRKDAPLHRMPLHPMLAAGVVPSRHPPKSSLVAEIAMFKFGKTLQAVPSSESLSLNTPVHFDAGLLPRLMAGHGELNARFATLLCRLDDDPQDAVC